MHRPVYWSRGSVPRVQNTKTVNNARCGAREQILHSLLSDLQLLLLTATGLDSAELSAVMDERAENPTILQKVYSKSCDVLENTMEIIASWQIGQSILKQTDKCLWMIEKSAEWSIPATSSPPAIQNDTNGTFGKPSPLIRPLPWVFFLPMLAILRVTRACLNLGAVFVGMDSVKPATIVRFIQVRRRRVRAMKFQGLRRMNLRKPCVRRNDGSEASPASWSERFYKTVSSAACFRYSHNDTSEKIVTKGSTLDALSPVCVENKRKYEEIEKYDELDLENADNEHILDKIDKLADDDSDEDPDFVPHAQSDEDSVSDGEDEPACTARPLLKRPSSHNSITNEVITEENEDSDSTTVSADSDNKDTGNQSVDKTILSKEINNKIEIKNNVPEHLIDSVTSDEYYSPQNSICPTPEPIKDATLANISKIDLTEPLNNSCVSDVVPNVLKESDPKVSSENIINSEKIQVEQNDVSTNLNGSKSPVKNIQDANNSTPNNHRGHGKKQKHKRKFSNLLRRNRK